jgi:hypothetical protein
MLSASRGYAEDGVESDEDGCGVERRGFACGTAALPDPAQSLLRGLTLSP